MKWRDRDAISFGMTNLPPSPTESGRFSVLLVYALFLLSIPSLAIFALIGVILAIAAKDGAGPFSLAHLDNQIRIWFVAFWWGVGLAAAAIVGWLLTVILVGFVILWIVGILALIVMIWFTVKSLLGMLAFLDNRAPRAVR